MSKTVWVVLVGGPFDGRRLRVTGPPPLLLVYGEGDEPPWSIERYAPDRVPDRDGRIQRWYWKGMSGSDGEES